MSPEALTAMEEVLTFLEAVEDGVTMQRPAPPLPVLHELYEAGMLDAWDELERMAVEAAGELFDEADADDSDMWYTAGLEEWWLDTYADEGCTFMLGVSEGSWTWNDKAKGRVFISARRLGRRKTAFPLATVPFSIDSGGFTELRLHGGWKTTPEEYVALVRRVRVQTKGLEWAAIQDWMVEDDALVATDVIDYAAIDATRETELRELAKKWGRLKRKPCTMPEYLVRAGADGELVAAAVAAAVLKHQEWTVASFLTLRALAPEINWLPVLQGQTLDQYLHHVEMYRAVGVDLRSMVRVGLGSVCRRHSSDEIYEVVSELHARGIRLHGFGMKTQGLERCANMLRSSDSLAWSFNGRKVTNETGRRDSNGASLQNSQEFAEEWRERMDVAAEGTWRLWLSVVRWPV